METMTEHGEANFNFEMPDFDEAQSAVDQYALSESAQLDPELEAFLSGNEGDAELPEVERRAVVPMTKAQSPAGHESSADVEPSVQPMPADVHTAVTAAPIAAAAGSVTTSPVAVEAKSGSIAKAVCIGTGVGALVLILGGLGFYMLVPGAGVSNAPQAPVVVPNAAERDAVNAVPTPLPPIELPQAKVPDMQLPVQPATSAAVDPASAATPAAESSSNPMAEPVIEPIAQVATSAPVDIAPPAGQTPADKVAPLAVEVVGAGATPEMVDRLRTLSEAATAVPAPVSVAHVEAPVAAVEAAIPAPADAIPAADRGLRNEIGLIADRMTDMEAAMIKNANAVASLERATRETAQSIVALRATVGEVQKEQGVIRSALKESDRRIASIESKYRATPTSTAKPISAARPVASAPVQQPVPAAQVATATPIDTYVITAITDNGAIVKQKQTEEIVILLEGRDLQGVGRVVEVDARKRHVLIEAVGGHRYLISSAK